MKKRVLTILPLITGLAVLCVWLLEPGVDVPDYHHVRERYRQSDRLLLDIQGRILDERRIDPNGRRLEWETLGELSHSLIESVILAEDKRFWTHGGIDSLAVISSLWQTVSTGRPRGASTITMQLGSLLAPDSKPRKSRRTIGQKWYQIRLALYLEKHWSKKEILESYLNLVSFRGELQGVSAAARGLFRKSPHGITDLEAVVLAALIRAPNAPPERVANRAEVLALKFESIGTGVAGELATEVLSRPYFVKSRGNSAPHVARKLLTVLIDQNSIRSSLDLDIQEFANSIVRQRLMDLSKQNVQDATLLIVENVSGAIKAYVGNGGVYSSAQHVDGIRALRQAGSTLKPFLYAEAFAQRILTPASLLDDSALNVPVAGGIYRPSNYDNLHRGPVTCRTALASSLNIPAVRALDLLGEERFIARLRSLGFDGLEEAEVYGPSIALGSADVSLWNLVNAYRTLANKGIWTPLTLLPDSVVEHDSRLVFSEDVVFLISSILSDRESRSTTFGLDSPLSTRFWSAVKTGTSKDMRDNWCVGYTSEYTVGAWVGNFSGEPMWNVSGITGAAPLWVEMMNFLHRSRPSTPPEIPDGLYKREIRFATSKNPREEWFLNGTGSDVVKPGQSRAVPSRIVYPAWGTVVALDPDIPVDLQRMYFEALPASEAYQWRLNGKRIGNASDLLIWKPIEGAHQLSLVEEGGGVTDQVSFYVRGFRE